MGTNGARADGTRADGTWSAPGRVNLIGEHTDYNDGFVLPLALDRRTRVHAAVTAGPSSVTSTAEGEPVRFDAATVGPGDVTGWGAYVAGVCWALREDGVPVPDIATEVSSDVPIGAGLSSSAALECATGLAACALAGTDLDPTRLARLCRRAENEFVGAPTGGMDQMAAMHGRAGALVFLDTRSDAVELVDVDLGGAGLELLVIDTRAPHRLVDGQYAARRADCEAAAAALGVPALRDATEADVETLADDRLRRRARHVVTENARVLDVVELLRAGRDPRTIGPLLTASHVSLRDDFAVTVPHLDVAVDAALDAGAHGARMTGGGFGGCVLALVDDGEGGSAGARVSARVRAAFAEAGFGPPEIFTAVPSDGARAED